MRFHSPSRRLSGPRMPAILLGLIAAVALAGPAHARCGNEVEVKAGETLSDLATRCDVSEARILDLNPKIEGSKDLRAGMTVDLTAPTAKDVGDRVREGASSLFGRLKSYADEAGEKIEGAAEKATQSVEDFIARNPDLHRQVSKLGERLDIPGMEEAEARVSLSVRQGAPGSPVTLSAIGLPPNQQVEIAGGPPDGDYEIIEQARTSADGTLQTTVLLPEGADPQRDFIFVIASPGIDVAARSATFDVVEATTGGK